MHEASALARMAAPGRPAGRLCWLAHTFLSGSRPVDEERQAVGKAE